MLKENVTLYTVNNNTVIKSGNSAHSCRKGAVFFRLCELKLCNISWMNLQFLFSLLHLEIV